tara:strand:+ start:3336 stop:4490 length:1155 start_codon:yes stop_codon:yes gene_type:complete
MSNPNPSPLGDINSGYISSNNSTPSPVNGMMYFFILTIIYVLVNIFLIYTSSTFNNTIITVVYSILLLLGLYFINVSTIKQLCGSDDAAYKPPLSKIMTLTVGPWLVIFGSLFFLLELYPGWIKPFSNTFGYLVVNFLGIEKILKKILKSNDEVDEKENGLIKAINYIENNASTFINQFDTNDIEFENFFKKIKDSKLLKDELFKDGDVKSSNFYLKLHKLVRIKNEIGKAVWYILSGTIIASVSYNILMDIKCEKSNQQMTDIIANQMGQPEILNGTKWSIQIARDESEKTVLDRNYMNWEKINIGALRRSSPGFVNVFQTRKDSTNGVPFTSNDMPDTDNYVIFSNYELTGFGVDYEFASNNYIQIDAPFNNVVSIYFVPIE